MEILTSQYLVKKVVEKFGPDPFLSKPDEQPGAQGAVQEELRTARRKVRGYKNAFSNFLVRLDLAPRLSLEEQAIIAINKNLKFEKDPESNVIQISLKTKSPELSRDALDSLLKFYLQHHIDVHGSQVTPDFTQRESEKILAELTAREEELEKFRVGNDIASLEEQKNALIREISGLQAQVDAAASQVKASKESVAVLEPALQMHSEKREISRTTGRTNFAADAYKERLVELRIEETELSSKYPDDYRPLVEVREQIRLIEQALGGENETHTEVTVGIDVNNPYQKVEFELDSERARLEAETARRDFLSAEIAERRKMLSNLAKHEVKLARLERNVDVLAQEYAEYRNNLMRAKISSAMDQMQVSNVSIVQPATLSYDPIFPKKKLNIALGILFGIFGAIAFAFFLEFLDDSLKTNEAVEKRLGYPVLAAVTYEEFKRCT